MRIIAFSDTHGNYSAMHKIFKRNSDVKTFIFLGDGERELDEMRELYPDKTILNVSGNCDFASLSPSADIFDTEDARVFFTHGHSYGVKYSTDRLFYKAKELNAQVVLFGHTHCRQYEYCDGVHIINPGSAGNPRDGKPACYAFVDITPKGILCSHVDL